jgi:hypothetical protein
MRAMAIPAFGGKFFAFKDCLPVQTLLVNYGDILMAILALDSIQAGGRPGWISDIMITVAIPALGVLLIGSFIDDCMDTLIINRLNIIMTHAAVHGFDIFFMRKFGIGEISVAVNTIGITVNRFFIFIEIDIQGYFLAVFLFGQFRIAMA